MTDIFDIKANFVPFIFDINLSVIYAIFVLILALIIYFYTRVPDIDIEKIDYKNAKINFFLLLESIKKHHLNSDSEVYYKKVKDFLILYFEYKTKTKMSKMTLYEIEKMWFSSWFWELFKEIYFRQYSESLFEDNIDYRKSLLERLEREI